MSFQTRVLGAITGLLALALRELRKELIHRLQRRLSLLTRARESAQRQVVRY